MLLAGVRLLCGGPFLSETHGFTRFCAGECVRTLQDISSHWNRKAALDKNKTESFRLHNSLRQSPAREMLAALYFLHTCERFFFKSVLELGPASVQQNLRRVTAFVYLSMVLTRSATRAGVFLTATMEQMNSSEQPDGSLTLLFAKHKTAKSYGSLACKLASWCVEILADYLKDVRPLLVSQGYFITTSDIFLFPKRTNEFLDAYLSQVLGGAHGINVSHIRSMFCEVFHLSLSPSLSLSLALCVCVCERERERDRQTHMHRCKHTRSRAHTHTHTHTHAGRGSFTRWAIC